MRERERQREQQKEDRKRERDSERVEEEDRKLTGVLLLIRANVSVFPERWVLNQSFNSVCGTAPPEPRKPSSYLQ